MISKEEMSGESNTGASPKLILNEIRINGNEGKFLYKDVLGGRKESEKKDGKTDTLKKRLVILLNWSFLKFVENCRSIKKVEIH